MRLTVSSAKWLCLLMAMASLPAARADGPQSSFNAAFQYHCAGGSSLAPHPQLPTLQKVLASRSTTNFLNLAGTRFAGYLTNCLQLGSNPASASLIEPLLSDVVTSESVGRFGGVSGNMSSFILALHLEASRAQLWQDNVGKIFGGTGEEFASQEFKGRRWNADGSNAMWIIPARDWLLVGRGDDFSQRQTEYLSQIKAQGRPVPAMEHNWLEADLALARLGGRFRLLQPAHIRITVAPDKDNLQVGARILTTEAIPWKSKPWRIPKDLIRGQVISFTAGQNVAAFLKMNPDLSHLAGNPLTNQFFCWALDQMPLLNYMAWPEAEASNVLAKLCTELPAKLNPELKKFNGTELIVQPKGDALILHNIRLFVPALQAVQGADGPFLFLSSFPRSSKAPPAPEGLLAQVEGHTNLVYYDWELTGRRLQEWGMLSKMIANRALPQNSHANDDAAVENEWLGGLGQLAGNTVSEMTHVAPNELSFVRKGPLGLTAVELVLLADWICDANSGPIHSPQPAGFPMPPPGK
jgi:hypothetical protein